MARPNDSDAGAVRLVNLAVASLGGTARNAVVRLKWGADRPESAMKNVRNWQKGDYKPAFVDLLDMLDEAGLLSDAAHEAWLGLTPQEWEAQQAQRAAEEAERAATAIPLERRPRVRDDQERSA